MRYPGPVAPAVLSLLMSAAVAAAAGSGPADLAAIPLPAVQDLVEQAQAPAPTIVELKTGYYGTVTVNHAAHLERKAHCKDCHGPGRVGPIEFTPKLAHDRCRSCHSERKQGPTDCRGCHVLPPPAPEAAEAPAKEPPAPAAAPQAAPTTAPARHGAIAEIHEEVRLDEPPPPMPFLRSVQAGGVAGNGAGLSVRVSLRRDALMVSQSVDYMGGWGRSRTLVTLGLGASVPLERIDALRVEAEGLGGLDVAGAPGPEALPAVGARVGVAWAPPWARRFPLFLTVTALVDLFHGTLASPACAYATVGVGTRPAER